MNENVCGSIVFVFACKAKNRVYYCGNYSGRKDVRWIQRKEKKEETHRDTDEVTSCLVREKRGEKRRRERIHYESQRLVVEQEEEEEENKLTQFRDTGHKAKEKKVAE